jgi:hypothetical protein
MFKVFTSVYHAIRNWLFAGVQDQYLKVKPTPMAKTVVEEIPERLRADDVPDFGVDQEKMLQMAVKNFTDDSLRIKWLKTIHRLRFGTRFGWIGESNGPSPIDTRFTPSKGDIGFKLHDFGERGLRDHNHFALLEGKLISTNQSTGRAQVSTPEEILDILRSVTTVPLNLSSLPPKPKKEGHLTLVS